MKEQKLSSNIALIAAYFQKLEDDNFFGTIEVTLNAGKLAYTRELKSRQDFEIALDSWERLPKSARDQLLKKYKSNAKFKAAAGDQEI